MITELKRAYDPAEPSDGLRVYIDRLWPRGLSHETFHFDVWVKDIAPTAELREWFHADPDTRWDEFERRYADYLRALPAFATFRKHLELYPKVTLLYSSRDREHNNAVVVKSLLDEG